MNGEADMVFAVTVLDDESVCIFFFSSSWTTTFPADKNHRENDFRFIIYSFCYTKLKKITEYYDFFEIETSDIDQSDENDEEKEIKLES